MSETVLNAIVRDKRAWVDAQKARQPLHEFDARLTPSDRDFYQALRRPQCAFILECKKASPSRGLIRADFDPAAIAAVYREYAAAISVLTDTRYFQGDFAYLTQVRAVAPQPVLCKDFFIDPWQVAYARLHQADAILLMLSVLDDAQYRTLAAAAHALNMGVLTEVSNAGELERAIRLQARVIGINNRDLRDLSIDLNRTRQLAARLPDDVTVISESGILRHEHVRDLARYVNGFLIGSALMGEADLHQAVRRVLYGENKVCGLTRPEDAQAAWQAGAVYGGLIFVAGSPRCVTADAARAIRAAAPLQWVGVFRGQSVSEIVRHAHDLALAAVQLHGDEDQLFIDQLRAALPPTTAIWKALSIAATPPVCDRQHIDRYVFDHGRGGSGQRFDWSLLAAVPQRATALLAGGINAANCRQAAAVGCAGLDINSGAESAPGHKDPAQLQAIFAALRPRARQASSTIPSVTHDLT